MASVSDSASVNGGTRTSGAGLVLTRDRAGGRVTAMRHSQMVRALRKMLPLSAFALLGLYGFLVLKTTGFGASIARLEIPKIVAENLAMDNPHYEGFNKDGGRYWVTAKKAMQDLKNMSVINLDQITGELTDAEKRKTKLAALRGTFNNKANLLELYDQIDVAGDNGLKARLTRATIQTKENIITSDKPVAVVMETGKISANQMTIRQKTKEYIFSDNVRTILKGREQAPGTPTTATAPQVFGNTNDPIDITSKRLDVKDAEKTALFTGTVKAVQGTSWLTTPELKVEYEGGAVAAGTADTQKDAGGTVKRVIAANPVVLQQGLSQNVKSQSAEFDAIEQKAVLEGEVVMTEVPDKRATGDRAEVDQAAGTVLLTGALVVLTQGTNELRGRRMFFNRTNGKMQLTGNGTAGGGRIKARFSNASAKAAATPKPSKAMASGLALGGSFKTDPNAPVDLDADKLEIDDGAKQAVFSGGVVAKQGDFVLQAAQLTATYTGAAGLNSNAAAPGKEEPAAQLTRLKADKNVVITSRDGQKATGDWADFDTKANTVTLGGNVVMTQGKNIVKGTKLVIDMTTGQSVIPSEGVMSSSEPMTSEGDSTGAIVRSGRPSLTVYPNDVRNNAAKAGNNATDGWQAREPSSKTP